MIPIRYLFLEAIYSAVEQNNITEYPTNKFTDTNNATSSIIYNLFRSITSSMRLCKSHGDTIYVHRKWKCSMKYPFRMCGMQLILNNNILISNYKFIYL